MSIEKKQVSFAFLPVGFQPRPVFVEVWGDGDNDFKIYPIIGVETSLKEYSADGGLEPDHVFVFCDDDNLLTLVDDQDIRSGDTATSVVLCTWPPEEDEQRLAETIAHLKQETLRRQKQRELKKQAVGSDRVVSVS